MKKLYLFGPLLLFFFTSPTFAQINQNFGTGSGIKIIVVSKFPSVFTQPGSDSTNIAQVCNLNQAVDLVLDVVNRNKIEFSEPIDNTKICDDTTISNMSNYVQADKPGEVTVRSDEFPSLNKPAEVTMRNLQFDSEPDILVEGKPSTSQDIDGKQWDASTKTLKFKAKHFSTYKAVIAKSQADPSVVSVVSPVNQQTTKSQNPILLIAVLVVLLVGFSGLLGFVVWKKKKELPNNE